MNKLEAYKKLNNSFKKEYIFHLGAEAGFYSEFNNMVSAILYCLKYEYKFVLYSKDANFGYKNGWTDYFLPFCNETTFFIHRYFNKRTSYPRRRHILYPFYTIYRLLFKHTYLTYDLWAKYFCKDFDNESFDIPSLGIKGDLRIASSKIVEMIYQFNRDTKFQINNYKNTVSLPIEYISMQIRRGDKITECSFLPIVKYFQVAEQNTTIRNLFVLTDDFSVIKEIAKTQKDWNIYTLAESSEKGYNHSEFVSLSKLEKKERILKLFASLELIISSELFVGSYTANTGLFLGMKMPFEKIISVQKREWFRFSTDDVIHQYKVIFG